MRPDKGKGVQTSSLPRRESSAGVTPQRPSIKNRANSAPHIPKNNPDGALDALDDDKDGEEITDDAFFQRYHFPIPIESTKEEASDSSVDSSSDTEGPLSPTHVKHRQAAATDVPSEPSTGVRLAPCPRPMPTLNTDPLPILVCQQRLGHGRHA